jgi:hypothetical protein
MLTIASTVVDVRCLIILCFCSSMDMYWKGKMDSEQVASSRSVVVLSCGCRIYLRNPINKVT